MAIVVKNLPNTSRIGLPLAQVSELFLKASEGWWRKRKNGKLSKASMILRAIATQQGIKTDEIRNLADACSNPADSIRDINNKLMNKGLLIVRMDPIGVAHNECCHHWFLVEAPIEKVKVQMSSNDPLYKKES